jgi:hypothetical protein
MNSGEEIAEKYLSGVRVGETDLLISLFIFILLLRKSGGYPLNGFDK